MTDPLNGQGAGPAAAGPAADQDSAEEPGVRVTDKRRLDPESGAVREPGPATAPSEEAAASVISDELSERIEDLRRLKAEYDNYRRRIERDRATWGELAVARVVGDLLPALDDVDRAQAHGELEGAFRAVAEQIQKALTSAGLARFGAVGDPFDPAHHEALTSVPVPGTTVEQVLEVYRSGYEFGGKVLRAAQVVVATPAGDAVAE